MSLLFGFCNAGFKTTTRIFADQKVEGRENVPETGPVIFISNHLSNLGPGDHGLFNRTLSPVSWLRKSCSAFLFLHFCSRNTVLTR